MKYASLQYLRIFGFLEGVSYLAFAITMPLKYVYELHEPNYVVGMIHGVLFITYCVLVLLVARQHKWKFFPTTFAAGIASLLPFGTFVADAKIFRKVDKA